MPLLATSGCRASHRRHLCSWVCALALAAIGCQHDGRAPGPTPADAGSDAELAASADADAAADGDAEMAEARCGLELRAWLIEGEPLTLALACESGVELDPDAIEIAGGPDGVCLDPLRRELHWTPRLDQAGNHVITLRLSRHERGYVRVGVADRFEDPNNVPVVDPLNYTHELGLPVFHLDAAANINDDEYTPAGLIYAGRAYAGAGAKYRGATSSKYPKRSFTLKFDKDARFVDAPRGFSGARRVVLTTSFDDNSYLRQRLAFELWNTLDDAHIPIQHFNAVVYLNGNYQGVYTVSDHVNDDFLSALGFEPDVNMYKARKHDANFRLTDPMGEPKQRLRAGYTKEEGQPETGPEAYADLESLLDWVANSSDEDFYAECSVRLASDFEHWFMLVSLIGAVDTTAKNYFLVHDARPDAADPRWRFIPWDFNASFGQTYRTLRRGPETYDLARMGRSNRLFERLLAEPRLQEPIVQGYREAMEDIWSAERILQLLERYAQEVRAAAERDELRWDAAYREYWSERTDFVSHREEIDYLQRWIPTRWQLVADQLQ
jgi:spore coat protein H